MKDTAIIDDFAMKFLQIASTIEQFADLDNITVEEVIGRLKAHEERVRGQSESGEGKLLLTHQEWLERSKKKGDEEQRTSQRNTRSSASNNRERGRGWGRGNYSNRGGRRGGGSYQNQDGGRGSTSNYDKSKDVYHIPSLCNNIISLGQLSEHGDMIQISGAHLWVHDKNGKLLMKVNRSPNRLYKIVLNEVEPHCLFGEHKEHSWLWHSRLGHVNFQKLKEMCDKNLVHGLKAIEKPDALCKGCLEGKQTRNPYPTQTLYKAKERLELIHADICGPISPPTPAGNRYFFLLVDDFSRVMWVYMLKSKDEALGMFQKFRVLVENETGVKVKTLRTDRGGEFNSKAFTEYCEDTGLKHHFTAPYSPQQNGVVERRNRSVIEMARSMMKSMEVPDTLWGEAVRQAVYIQN
ncbi:putative RNA-directed DNA polymerase [Tanacetum coccineum]